MGKIVIELKNISKKYNKVNVIENMDISIEHGEIAGIIGPNGVGKSTTLNIMSGLSKPDSGEVIFDGKPVKEYKSSIGFVPQEIALYQDLTVKDNLKFFAGLYGLSKKESKDKIEYIVETLELKDNEKKKVKNLSGGMKRRLNIGVELIKDPIALIMDEPTVGIDISARNSIIRLLKNINEKGITIVFTSHYMSELKTLCSKFYFLKDGKIYLKGTLDEIYSYEGVNETLEDVYNKIFIDFKK
jgi:ABC-2 type transport system ATP-binding protein